MDNNIILSIIVPVYNVEKYLDTCLKSIIDNYEEGIEIILIDDGSKDRSDAICDEYAKKYEYIKVKHKENGGLSSARNVGIKVAKGKYIWFVDSDDYVKAESISEIIKMAKNDTDLILTSHCNVFPDGTSIETYLDEPTENILPYEYFYNIGSASYAAVRFIAKKELIIRENIFFTEGIYHEDEEWSPRLLCSAKTFVVIPNSIYNYRVGNPQSIMGMSNPKKVYDKIYISKKIYNKIKDENLQGKMADFLNYRVEHNFIVALNELVAYSGNEKKNMIKEIKENIYVLDNINTKKVKLVKNTIKIIGVSNTAKVLTLRNKIK